MGLREYFGEAGELPAAEPPVAMNGPVATPVDSAISASFAAPAHKRKYGNAIVAAHVVAPKLRRRLDAADIDVVIAGNRGDVAGLPSAFSQSRACIFSRQREIDEVTGHRDMVETSQVFRSRTIASRISGR